MDPHASFWAHERLRSTPVAVAAWDPVSSGSQTAGDQLRSRVERGPEIENAARPLMPLQWGNATGSGRDLRATPRPAPQPAPRWRTAGSRRKLRNWRRPIRRTCGSDRTCLEAAGRRPAPSPPVPRWQRLGRGHRNGCAQTTIRFAQPARAAPSGHPIVCANETRTSLRDHTTPPAA